MLRRRAAHCVVCGSAAVLVYSSVPRGFALRATAARGRSQDDNELRLLASFSAREGSAFGCCLAACTEMKAARPAQCLAGTRYACERRPGALVLHGQVCLFPSVSYSTLASFGLGPNRWLRTRLRSSAGLTAGPRSEIIYSPQRPPTCSSSEAVARSNTPAAAQPANPKR